MARMNRKRVRPASGLGRTPPPPTDEDLWMAEGAPGYDRPQSENPNRWQSAHLPWQPDDPTKSGSAGDASPTPSSSSAEAESTTPTGSQLLSTGSFVRMATASLKPGMLRVLQGHYEEALLPLYRSQPGFRGAQLLASADEVSVSTITWWATAEDAERAAEAPQYRSAMRQLAACFEGRPTVHAMSALLVAHPSGNGGEVRR